MEKELNENKGIDIMKNTDTMDIIENGNQLMDISGNASTGLTAAEVEERTARGLVNRADITTDKTTSQIIKSNLFTYFNLIFHVSDTHLRAHETLMNMVLRDLG